MEEWLNSYYAELNPVKRQQILEENSRDTQSVDGQLRHQLWTARYGKGKPKSDAFVGYLMNLKYIADSDRLDPGGRKKKLAIEALMGLKLYEFEKKSEMEQEIIVSELKNTCKRYMDISAGGRGFTSVIFGMGQLSEESIAGKLAEQVSKFAYEAPHILRMDKEFEPLQRVAVEVFCELYPNRVHFLKKR